MVFTTAKRVYVGSRWAVEEVNVKQARRMMYERSECWEFVRGKGWGVAPGDEPLILMRCHNFGLLWLFEALEGCKSVWPM